MTKTDLTFGPQEIRGLLKGLIPSEMEEKWFVYFEDSILHFHRSWTGFETLRLHLNPIVGEQCVWRSETLEVNSHPDQCQLADDEALDITRALLEAIQQAV